MVVDDVLSSIVGLTGANKAIVVQLALKGQEFGVCRKSMRGKDEKDTSKAL